MGRGRGRQASERLYTGGSVVVNEDAADSILQLRSGSHQSTTVFAAESTRCKEKKRERERVSE